MNDRRPAFRGTELGLWGRLMEYSTSVFIREAVAKDPNLDVSVLTKAYHFAEEAHSGQQRASHEPFITHPAAVALQVAELHQGIDAVVAALLHDCIEDAHVTLDTISEAFGMAVASLVMGLTKLSALEIPHRETRQAEYLRRLLLAVSDDVRVIVIKLADRLHNMFTLSSLDADRRRRIAIETLEIYAPLAHSLGMGTFRTQLEDLSFKELDPISYREIRDMISTRRSERENEVNSLIRELTDILKKEGLAVQIEGRAKHFYGVYRKIRRSHKSYRDIWDLLGIRIITNSIDDCYRALGIVHAEWTPVDGRFKDYLARPKPNMYRSIHTTVMTPNGTSVELQIRTHEMHAIAEFGVAAHWRYHAEREGGDYVLRDHMGWFRDLISAGETSGDPQEILRIFKQGLISNEVMVLTPKGELIPIRSGASALDFAFQLHTTLGLHCSGVRVNGKAVPLGYRLQSGDRVEIMSSPTAHPTQDWLSRVYTSSARQKIRRFLHRAERERQQTKGRALIVRGMRKASLVLPRTPGAWEEIAGKLGYPTAGELFLAVGSEKATLKHVIDQLADTKEEDSESETFEEVAKDADRSKRGSPRGIRLGELRDIALRFAHCCSPIPGDRIVALVTRGRGASIHRRNCHNAFRGDQDRWFAVEWDAGQNDTFVAGIVLKTTRRKALLGEIEPIITQQDAEFRSMGVHPGADNVRIRVSLAVRNTNHLASVVNALRRMPGVKGVTRARGTK